MSLSYLIQYELLYLNINLKDKIHYFYFQFVGVSTVFIINLLYRNWLLIKV